MWTLLYETEKKEKKATTELLRDHFISASSLFKGILPAAFCQLAAAQASTFHMVQQGDDPLLLLQGNCITDYFLMSSKFLLGDIRVHLAPSRTADREGDGDTLPRAEDSCSEDLGPQAPATGIAQPWHQQLCSQSDVGHGEVDAKLPCQQTP